LLCPTSSTSQSQACRGDFQQAKRALQVCGFSESEFSDVFHVLMEQGAFCDCEILYNFSDESRLKARYWQNKHRTQGFHQS
jgi:hypothetical protein